MSRVLRIDGKVDQSFRWNQRRPAAPSVSADKEALRARVVPVHRLPLRPQDMEVRLAEQRDRIPAAPAVGRPDQPQMRGQLVSQIGMSRSKEDLRRDEREAHRVLVAVADPACLLSIWKQLEHAGVGGDVEDGPLGVEAEPVHMLGPGILRLERCPGELLRGGLLIGAATTRSDEKSSYNCGG